MGGYQARYWSVGRFTAAFASLPAAEHNLAHVCWPRKSHSARQLLAQLGEYLRLGNNRQAVTDYIRHNFGQTPLNQLSPEQLKPFSPCCRKGRWLFLPQQREATDRPLLPAGAQCAQTTGDQTCGSTGNQQTDLAIDAGTFRVKDGELIPAKLFNHLVTLAAGASDAKPAKYADTGITTDGAKTTFRCQ